MQKDKSWYQKSAEDAFDALESGTAGLSTGESRARLEEYGYFSSGYVDGYCSYSGSGIR